MEIKKKLEAKEVVDDIELFLRAQRLQDLILPEQQTIIDAITNGWIGESYRGLNRGISLKEWIKQSLIDTSKK